MCLAQTKQTETEKEKEKDTLLLVTVLISLAKMLQQEPEVHSKLMHRHRL